MKKKLQIFALITGTIGIIIVIYMLRKMYKENELRNLLDGIAKLKDENLSLVSISNKTSRYLMKENDDSQTIFNQFMEQKGWEENRQFGRSHLYIQHGKEMLVKKTDLLNGYCVFEWMDENYVKNKAV